MRLFTAMMALGLSACASDSSRQQMPTASEVSAIAPVSGAGNAFSSSPADGPFTGSWLSCEGAASEEECDRYDLVQRGSRICGTWSYVASGQVYEGRVVAQATWERHAQRTHVCGRPGSETDTECDEGWQTISSPLQLCDGKLSDTPMADGSCNADFSRMPGTPAELEELTASPWMEECLGAALPD